MDEEREVLLIFESPEEAARARGGHGDIKLSGGRMAHASFYPLHPPAGYFGS